MLAEMVQSMHKAAKLPLGSRLEKIEASSIDYYQEALLRTVSTGKYCTVWHAKAERSTKNKDCEVTVREEGTRQATYSYR